MTQSTEALKYFFLPAVLLVFYLNLAIELQRHRQNRRALTFIGARLEHRSVYGAFYAIFLITPLILLVILALSDFDWAFGALQITGVTVLFLSQLIRSSAISAMGNGWVMGYCWSERWQKIKSGPYRLLDHPEYVSRWFDIAGFLLLFGQIKWAMIVLPLYFLACLALSIFEAISMSSDVIGKRLSKQS